MKPKHKIAKLKDGRMLSFPPNTPRHEVEASVKRYLGIEKAQSNAIKQIESASKILDNQSRRQSVDVYAANATMSQKFDALAASMTAGFIELRKSNESLVAAIRDLVAAENDSRQGLSVMLSAHMDAQNRQMEEMKQMISAPRKNTIKLTRGADGRTSGAVGESVIQKIP